MVIAAFILSFLGFMMSGACLIWMLAKHFSSHSIQPVMVPMEDEIGRMLEQNRPTPPSPLKDFEEPLTAEEEEYYLKHNSKIKQ